VRKLRERLGRELEYGSQGLCRLGGHFWGRAGWRRGAAMAVVLVMKRKGWWWAWLCGRGSCSQRVGGWLARLLVLVGLRAVRCRAVPSGSASGSAYRRAADASGRRCDFRRWGWGYKGKKADGAGRTSAASPLELVCFHGAAWF
jgi:hypothetical protein